MKTKILLTSVIAILFLSSLFFITTANASPLKLYTASGFINLLIEKGIIPETKIQKAKELSSLIQNSTNFENKKEKTLNADKVEVSASQFIEHASLKYEAYDDIEGLLLLVKNISDKNIFLEAKRGCPVVYVIYDNKDNVVYNSADEEKCKTDEKVKYLLQSGQTRMFTINHKKELKKLKRGVYDIKMKYPGYGEDKKTITVE